MSDTQPLSDDPRAGLGAPPPAPTEALLAQAHAAAAKGDMEGANAAFFQIPADERKARGLYAGPGGADPAASGSAAAALGGASAVSAVARAVAGGGPTIAGKAVEGFKAAASNQIIRYQATKHLLESLGVPPAFAEPVAMALAGKGGKSAATTAGAAPAEAVAAPGALTAVEEAQLVKQGFPPSVIAKIRAGAAKPPPAAARATPPAAPAPAPPGAAAETPPVAAGPSAPAPAPSAPVAAGPNPRISASELPEFQRLVKQGKSVRQAYELIAAQRALVERLGLPTVDAARRAVVDRNTSGRWPE